MCHEGPFLQPNPALLPGVGVWSGVPVHHLNRGKPADVHEPNVMLQVTIGRTVYLLLLLCLDDTFTYTFVRITVSYLCIFMVT